MLSRAIARGLALFVGVSAALNGVGEWLHAEFDTSPLWLDMRGLGERWQSGLQWSFALLLLLYALRPDAGRWRRGATALVLTAMIAKALVDVANVWWLATADRIALGFPVPLSLFVAGTGVWLLCAVLKARPTRAERSREHAAAIAVAGGAAVGFALLQMLCFGGTDYRRPADAAVVFGARAYADGRPSLALADRVGTAARLYHQGLVRELILSGGPGDGAVHETEAMARHAVSLGVPRTALRLDVEGTNTARTVAFCAELARAEPTRRLLVVSHSYHLPRVDLEFRRVGLRVATVPAEETRTLARLPQFVAREVAAYWHSTFRPLWSSAPSAPG